MLEKEGFWCWHVYFDITFARAKVCLTKGGGGEVFWERCELGDVVGIFFWFTSLH